VTGLAKRFQQAQRSQADGIGRVLRHVEADAHVALRAQVVDFVGRIAPDNLVERACVLEIAEDQA
jgi:hypothetical protein